jgi:glucoamylase
MSAPAVAPGARTRAFVGPGRTGLRLAPSITWSDAGLRKIAQHMYSLMLRNVCSDGFLFSDPNSPGTLSVPGCIIAAPSFPGNTSAINQDYVYNWVRDAAITAMEIAAANQPTAPGTNVQALIDYVNFAQTCQNNANPTLGHACFTITGQSRPWTEQSDGPALQTVAILAAFNQLDTATQTKAKGVIATNLGCLLNEYQNPTTNLWEEHYGYSFFARAAQLKCFQVIKANTFGIPVPQGIDAAITWLQNTGLPGHWNGTTYVSILPAPNNSIPAGYDTNIDIVSACVYGGVACTDTKLLASAAILRYEFANSNSPDVYPINLSDNNQGLGPLMGRYPSDIYDGDTDDHTTGDHPWALCSCHLAQLYHKLANQITNSNSVPYDHLSATFFNQLGVTNTTPATQAVTALQNAADDIIGAVLYHSDHLELSEQFDGVTGFEKSVKNLTWSYAAFLSAAREKTGQSVRG